MTYLIIDMNNLCHKAYHGLPHLATTEGSATSVLYGVFRDIVQLKTDYYPCKLVFCFDKGDSKRAEIYPSYKIARRLMKEEDNKFYKGNGLKEINNQITLLREELLKEIGFNNVFYEEGFEADDIIASVVLSSLPENSERVIISSDKDLYQLLSSKVTLYSPYNKKYINLSDLVVKHKNGECLLTPDQWVDLKAICGCNSDSITGIEGIGEVNAAKYLTGELKSGTNFTKIIRGKNIWEKNKELVKLPYKNTPIYKIQKDKISRKRWKNVLERYGINSIKV